MVCNPMAMYCWEPSMYDSYSNQVLLNDATGFNQYVPPFNTKMVNNYGVNLCDSIFNSLPLNLGVGCNPCMDTLAFTGMGCSSDAMMNPWMMQYPAGGMCTPFTGDYYKQMMENQVNYQQQARTADIKLNAAQTNLEQKGLTLHEKITQNEQDQIMPAFKDYMDAVKQYYGNEGSYDDLKNQALKAYRQQFQKTIQEDIREHGSNSLAHGWKEIVTLGFADGVSAEQNIAKISGQDEGKMQKVYEFTGNVLGGATIGAATLFSKKISSLIPARSKLGKFGIITAACTAIACCIGLIKND